MKNIFCNQEAILIMLLTHDPKKVFTIYCYVLRIMKLSAIIVMANIFVHLEGVLCKAKKNVLLIKNERIMCIFLNAITDIHFNIHFLRLFNA